jgi:hypothetical protein
MRHTAAIAQFVPDSRFAAGAAPSRLREMRTLLFVIAHVNDSGVAFATARIGRGRT